MSGFLSVCLQVTSVGVRAALSPPVKREELFYIDNGTVDDQHADSSVQETRTHTVPETQTAAPGGGGGRVAKSGSGTFSRHIHNCEQRGRQPLGQCWNGLGGFSPLSPVHVCRLWVLSENLFQISVPVSNI